MKKIPLDVDAPKFLVKLGASDNAGEGKNATADLITPIGLYYLLRVGECQTNA